MSVAFLNTALLVELVVWIDRTSRLVNDLVDLLVVGVVRECIVSHSALESLDSWRLPACSSSNRVDVR